MCTLAPAGIIAIVVLVIALSTFIATVCVTAPVAGQRGLGIKSVNFE